MNVEECLCLSFNILFSVIDWFLLSYSISSTSNQSVWEALSSSSSISFLIDILKWCLRIKLFCSCSNTCLSDQSTREQYLFARACLSEQCSPLTVVTVQCKFGLTLSLSLAHFNAYLDWKRRQSEELKASRTWRSLRLSSQRCFSRPWFSSETWTLVSQHRIRCLGASSTIIVARHTHTVSCQGRLSSAKKCLSRRTNPCTSIDQYLVLFLYQ